jgi:hypothetical protein
LFWRSLRFFLLNQCYGIIDWAIKFGVVDWRDDEVIELIRDQRIRNGTWTLNRARSDVGEPPVPGGDDAILVDRQNMVLWNDLNDLSKANLAAVQAQGVPKDVMQPAKAPNAGDTGSAVEPAQSPGTPNVNVPKAMNSPDSPEPGI